jgi:hypothetical protein
VGESAAWPGSAPTSTVRAATGALVSAPVTSVTVPSLRFTT